MRAILRFWPDLKPRIAVYTLIIVLTAIANGISLVIPVITGAAIDGPIAAKRLDALWWPVLGIVAVGCAEAVAIWARRMLAAPLTSQLEVTWRARIYDHLQFIAISRHDAWQSGQLLSRATSDLSQLRRFFAFGAPFILVIPVTLVVGLVILAVLHPVFALVMLAAAVPTIITTTIFERRYRVASRLSQDQVGELTTSVEESVQGIRILKAFGRSPWSAARYRTLASGLRDTEITKARLDSFMWSLLIVLPDLALAAVLAIGTVGVVNGWLTVGSLVAAVSVMTFMRIPVEMLGFLLADAVMAATSAARYWEVVDIEQDITDPGGDIDPDPPVRAFTGELRFDGVDFRYADADRDQLHGVDLTVAPGRTIALVGATGAGKTALVSLIPRLRDATGGAVRLDGTDIRELPVNQLRRNVSVSFEEPILFSASVRENVALGHPGTGDDAVWEALRITAAAEFVAELPGGLDTQIGEQGLSLSGGQRQRLALARAVIGKPRVLVLDDPLSAVDVDTEDRVQTALRAVLAESTTIVVAHRPSTAALADAVAVLDAGRIADVGTHDELLARSPLYRDLMGATEREEVAGQA